MTEKLFSLGFLRKYHEYSPVLLRLLLGSFIIYGVQDNIFNHKQMTEFAHFLEQKNVPLPLASAFISAYAQMICGISILLGAFIRLTSVILIVNFIAAVIIAHLGDGFRETFPALTMIAAGFFFLLNGAGRMSFDELFGIESMTQD